MLALTRNTMQDVDVVFTYPDGIGELAKWYEEFYK